MRVTEKNIKTDIKRIYRKRKTEFAYIATFIFYH